MGYVHGSLQHHIRGWQGKERKRVGLRKRQEKVERVTFVYKFSKLFILY